MTRRGRGRPLVVAAMAAALVASGSLAAAGAARPATAPLDDVGFPVVQFSAGTSPSWTARLVSAPSGPTLALEGPHAAPDVEGGLQVAYRTPAGDVVWLDGTAATGYASVDLSRVLGLAPLLGEPVPAVSPQGLDEVFCVTRSEHLLLLTWDPYRRLPWGATLNRYDRWTRTDLTQLGGPRVAGTPSVVVDGSRTSVFTTTPAGDLVDYSTGTVPGRGWSGVDLSLVAAGPRIASDPSGFYDPGTQQVRVAATELAPHRGDVVVFSPNDLGGRVWSFSDVSIATGSPAIPGGVDAVVYGGDPTLLAAAASGALTAYTGDDKSTTKTTWTASDLTALTAGAPDVEGTPSASVSGTHLAVAATAADWGNLFEWSASAPGGAFVATDVSNVGAGATRSVTGDPDALFAGGQLSLFAAGVAAPAPEGTGVYSVPYVRWATALRDGWPVLGVTGGVGASCAPWTSVPSPTGSLQPDEHVGEVIQDLHARATWLSFWTVSGPGTLPSSACTKEKGPYTARTFYRHGYLAGRYVAAQIEAYRAQGLALQPDWVLFDPEGHPDDHSGLWGPTSPPSKLAQSVADWDAVLSGWSAGLASIDPLLKAGVYANQYEYTTYELDDQPVPAFIASAFSQAAVKGKTELVVPTRTAFGPNILGFVMYNAFSPTCAQVTDERLLLAAAPFEGDYNTIQLPPGRYCPPGPSPS